MSTNKDDGERLGRHNGTTDYSSDGADEQSKCCCHGSRVDWTWLGLIVLTICNAAQGIATLLLK